MHLLITGGAGFIGRALQEFLHARYSYTIYAPSSKELDLSKEAAVSSYIKAHKISHIIHLANRGGGRDTMGLTDLAEYNLRMFFAIMSQADRVERVLHFGSGAEYSKHKPIVSASEPSYLESLPLDSYGFYKGVCSRFIESTRGNVICLRIFGCYGAGENYRYKFISNAIVKNLLHLPITIYKDCIFDYIYIDDLLRIIDHFLHASISSLDHRVYNASSGSGILLSELAKIINATSPYKSPIHFIESGLNNQYTSDNSRLLSAMPALKLTPHSHAIESMREYFASNLTSLDVESIKADPYLSKIGEMWAAASNGGGGGKYLRDSAWLVDSACSDKSVIASRVLQLHTPSMRPCTRLQNANFSSTILESFAGSLTFLAFPKADSNPKILESKSSENHKTRRSRSFFSKSTASNFNLESIFSSQADSLLSSRALRQQGVAIHKSAKVDSSVKMDCRAIATALARNDKKNAAILNEQPKDSRFCDEKPLLCKPRKEIRLAVYRHSAAQQSKVYRAKPNPPAKFN